MRPFYGDLSEWLKEHAWKVCIRETVSRVRIPQSPQMGTNKPKFCLSPLYFGLRLTPPAISERKELPSSDRNALFFKLFMEGICAFIALSTRCSALVVPEPFGFDDITRKRLRAILTLDEDFQRTSSISFLWGIP